MRRLLATPLLALLLAVAVAVAAVPGAGPAGAQETTTTSVVEGADIIPEPNSGTEPDDAGDRGGILQSVLFGAIIVVVIGAGFVLVRQSRAARARRGF